MTDQTAGAVVDAPTIVDAPDAANSEAQVDAAQTDGNEAPVDPTAAELKRLQNYYTKSKGQQARQRAQIEQLARQVQQFQSQSSQPATQNQPASGEPKEDDPKYAGNYVAYLRDLAKYDGKSAAADELKAGQAKFQEAQTQQQHQAWIAQSNERLDKDEAAAEAAFTDFGNVVNDDVKELIATLSPHVHQAFREADNSAFALYDLANNPEQLEKLNSMSPFQVAAALVRAGDRALAKSKAKPVTNAPAPLTSSKGTGSGSKSIDAMSATELDKWRRAK